jgi:hypothetical protein
MSSPACRTSRSKQEVEREILRDGYTKIPHSLFRYWMPHLKGCELAFLCWLLDQTVGWHRPTTKMVAYSEIGAITGYSRHALERAVAVLVGLGLIQRSGRQGKKSVFSLNIEPLQQPIYSRDELVQKVAELRAIDLPKQKPSCGAKMDTSCLKTVQLDGPKQDTSEFANKEVKKSLKEIKKEKVTTASDAPFKSTVYPKSAEFITSTFPGTDRRMVEQILALVPPSETDDEIVHALTATWQKDQRRAALWLTTLKAYYENVSRKQALARSRCPTCDDTGLVYRDQTGMGSPEWFKRNSGLPEEQRYEPCPDCSPNAGQS